MTNDPKNLAVLVEFPNESEAAIIVAGLNERGIHAVTTGDYTSGFKAEAPGNVKVLVAQHDFEKAKQVLAEIRKESSEIDWSQIDVGEPEP